MRDKKPGAFLPLCAAALFWAGPASASTSPPVPLRPLKTERPPVVDGLLDDSVWAEAPSVTDFKTFMPDFGRTLSEETRAYYAYDCENLYFAFQCSDREPGRIKATLSKRDDFRTDDFICVNLDSFNDQQSLYAFYVNPLGVQMDSRYANSKEDYTVDLVWYSAGRLHDRGYAVELRIPLKSIRFSSGPRVEMGIFYERYIGRRSERGSCPPLDPAKGFAFLTEMAPIEYFGLRKYTLLELIPAFTYSQGYAQSEGRLARERVARDLSLTGKYGITPSLILDATLNPDFSQVEADAGQVDVNLRYDLYFPEKRPFFLEGSENFNLAGTTEDDFLLEAVHTRNIVNPQGGVKLSGKAARDDTVAVIFAADESPVTYSPLEPTLGTAYFSIVRYKHALSLDSSLGFFFTDREHEGRFNRVAGPDGQIRTSQSSLLSFYALGSFTRAAGGASRQDGHALDLDYLYDTRDWNIRVGGQDLSPGFATDAGYLIRNGLTRIRAYAAPKFHPRSSVLLQLTPGFFTSQLRDKSSGLWETQNTFSLSSVLVRTTRITVSGTYSTEIYLGRRFNTSGWTAQLSSQITKQFYLKVTYEDGKAIRYSEEPFQGYGKRALATLGYQPSENFNWTLSLTYSDLFRDPTEEKIYDYTILRNRLVYQVNKYLFFRVVVEYNDYRRQLLADLLASFLYIPGTVVQVGYGSLFDRVRWEDGAYVSADRFLETRRGIFFKASYLWRL
jgi:hypothetical protein